MMLCCICKNKVTNLKCDFETQTRHKSKSHNPLKKKEKKNRTAQNCSIITDILDLEIVKEENVRASHVACTDFTFASLQKVLEKSPDFSSDQSVTSSVPHAGYGTLDLANLDAAVGASYH